MTPISRRNFIKQAVLTTSAAWVAPQFSIGKSGPSATSKLNVACVGIGHVGAAAVQQSLMENLVALCDVDWRADPSVWARRIPADIAAENPDIPTFSDFRVMLDQMGNEIDTVIVSTPDHTHFPIAMAAMELGKHVFVQKPLARNIWQARTMHKAMKHYGVTTVMGNQGHTTDGIRYIKQWVDDGIVGEVREVHCWTDRPMPRWFVRPKQIPPVTEAVPDKLNWDLWQGPVQEGDYSPDYLPQRWRGWWKYGVGALGDIGCHTLDAPFLALQLGMPYAVDVALDEPANPEYTPFGAHVIYHFAARGDLPPVKVHWYEGRPRPKLLPGMDELPLNGMYMIGSRETVFQDDMRPDRPSLWPRQRMSDYGERVRELRIPRVKGGPHQELFRALKGEGPSPKSSFDYASRLTEVILLGTIAIRAGHRIEWDEKAMKISNRPELNAWVKEAVRPGWSYGENLW